MDRKIYNLEIIFESQKKSFVIISKNKITYDDLKQKTMREFRIPKEFEKDIKFTITVRNRPTVLLTDIQILNNFEEISKNNYYLKIILEVNNINYVYNSIKCPIIKYNPKIKPQSVKFFSIISTKKDEDNIYLIEEIDKYKENLENMENNYQDKINKLKEELEKVKSEKTNKGEIDIRKFDEKYRDLSNKNNILEQKINELENENKTLKIGAKKITLSENIFQENIFENDPMIKEIEKIFTKLMDEHDNNIIKEINGLKDTVELIQKEQKQLYEILGNKNQNFELLKDNKKTQNDEYVEDKKILIKEEENKNKNNISNNIENLINENNLKINKNINNSSGLDDNFDELENLADIIINDGEEAKNNNSQNSNYKKKQMLKGNSSQNIKRNINFYDDESFLSSKSKIKIIKKPENEKKNLIEEIKNCFLETNELKNKIITKKLSKNKDSEIMYSKYTVPSKNERMKIKNQKNIYNYTNFNKNNTSNEDILNFEACSEMNTDIKKILNGNKVNICNSHKNIFIKMNDRKRRSLNNFNKFLFSEKSITPSSIHITDRGEKNLYINKKQINITPTEKINKSKENIENYFLNIYQNIFFYGNNEYLNMLKISDKLLNKIKDGVSRYRFNIIEIKEYCIKYITYTIIPIVNDFNTKSYQRKIIKDKIRTILEALRIDPNYFDKDYKIFYEEKKERQYDERSFNSFNVTHTKINEFRKLYDLKEKEYPDEQIIKALIRYRGNRELAFQYLFY